MTRFFQITVIASFLCLAISAPKSVFAVETSTHLDVSPSDSLADHFYISQNEGALESRNDGGGNILTYRPSQDAAKNSALTAVLTPHRGELKSLASKVKLEFRLGQEGSFGVAVRAGGIKEPAYLILLGRDALGKGSIKFFNTQLLPSSPNVAREVFASKAFPRFGSRWNELQITTEESAAGAVILSVVLKDSDSGEEVRVSGVDDARPLRDPGLVALRFFLLPAAADGFEDGPREIDVRHVEITPALQ